MGNATFAYNDEIQDVIRNMTEDIKTLRRLYLQAFKDRKIDLCKALRRAGDILDTAICDLDDDWEGMWAQEACE